MLQAHELVKKWSEEKPKKVYLYFKDQEITYRQLETGMDSAVAKLLELGIQKSDRVALALKNCPEFLYIWLAICKIGAVSVPFNSILKAEETTFI